MLQHFRDESAARISYRLAWVASVMRSQVVTRWLESRRNDHQSSRVSLSSKFRLFSTLWGSQLRLADGEKKKPALGARYLRIYAGLTCGGCC
jgi:hypothetical protein